MLALVFDTETTGLTKHRRAKAALQPRIIEFGGLLIDEHGNEVDSLSILIDPSELITEEITKITGITNDDLKDAPKLDDAMPLIAALFARADVMIAHNLPFDRAMMDNEIRRIGVQGFKFPARGLCTVQENLETWGRRPKLTELYEKVMGVPLNQTHRALDDCRALAEVVLKEGYLEHFTSATANQD